ncbi:hypothetical protein [Micromonospora vulcania]|uniref:Glycine zipper family protein n=1 Tax=Micromonospora vulcania TaxID=1441873 RepID=A0ABW1HE91_9ACTN
MAEPEGQGSQSRAWAWWVGIVLGLVIGVLALGGPSGVGFGIAIGVAFAIALGATRKPAEVRPADDGPAAPENEDGEVPGDSRRG